MIVVAFILSIILGAAGQYYYGNEGSFLTICSIWAAVYFWKIIR